MSIQSLDNVFSELEHKNQHLLLLINNAEEIRKIAFSFCCLFIRDKIIFDKMFAKYRELLVSFYNVKIQICQKIQNEYSGDILTIAKSTQQEYETLLENVSENLSEQSVLHNINEQHYHKIEIAEKQIIQLLCN